jgi:hypothetical protein
MRMLLLPNIHRHADAHADLAADLGEMLGISGLRIHWTLGRGTWVLSVETEDDAGVRWFEALYALEGRGPAEGGPRITDRDMGNLVNMFLVKRGAAESFREGAAKVRAEDEAFRASDREELDQRRWIAKRDGRGDPRV